MAQTRKHGKIWVYDQVPFDNSFENAIYFKSQNEIDEFFDSSRLVHQIYYNDTYKQFTKTGDIRVEHNAKTFESASYMRFKNDDDGRMYYAFILDTRYLNENATLIIFEIDIWMTYQLELFENQFGGFVEQGTVKKFNSDGSRNIIPVQQGINVGNSYPGKTDPLGLKIDWLVCVLKPTAKINDADAYNNTMDFPGSFKSFRYFICPVMLNRNVALAFKYNNITYAKSDIKSLVQNLTNVFKFDESTEANTVNQCVALFTTKHCGLDYTYTGELSENSVIEISGVNFGIPHSLGTNYIPPTTPGNVATGSQDYLVDWSTDLVHGGHTLHASMIRRIVSWCRQYEILPIGVICQLYLESNWGDSAVAASDNNWSGMSWGAVNDQPYVTSSGVTVSRGGKRPESEGGYYRHYESVEDWLSDYMFLLRPKGVADGGGNMYRVAGKKTFDEYVLGLFIWGGADADYAHDPRYPGGTEIQWSIYNNIMQGILSGLRSSVGQDTINTINALAFNNGEWVTTDPIANNKGLEHLRNLLGQRVGNGQCYAAAAEYVGFMGGPELGAGTIYQNKELWMLPNGDGGSAAEIGEAYRWADTEWTVETWPGDINKIKIGDIVCYNRYTRYGPTEWGHVCIVKGVNVADDIISVYEQNVEGEYITEDDQLSRMEDMRSVIHPPGTATGGITSGNNTGNKYPTTIRGNYVLEIKNIQTYYDHTIDKENVLQVLEDELLLQLGYNTPNAIESQLLSSEFCKITLKNGFGATYVFSPEYMPSPDPEGNHRFFVSGCLGDSNYIFVGLAGYNNTAYGFADQIGKYYFGLTDMTPRDMTILSDQSATYFQANAMQNRTQQNIFGENQAALDAQINLSNRQVDLANRQSSYDSRYALENSIIRLTSDNINMASGAIGNALQGNFGGALQSVANGAGNFYQNTRNIENRQQQLAFNNERNSMRSESNNISNMQAKLSLNQGIQQYNARLKDLVNQPVAIQQVGSDMSFQNGNQVDDVYICYEFANPYNLKIANLYMRAYGVLQNQYYEDIRDIVKIRENFNFIKCGNIDLPKMAANKSHFNALKAIFVSGVRIWNYNDQIDNNFGRIESTYNEDI